MYLDLIAKLSPTSKLSGQEQAAVVITGLVVVFLVLAFLVLFVSWFGKLFDKSKKNNTEKPSAPAAPRTAPIVKPSAPVVKYDESDEVVAAISAAIAQMSLNDGKVYKIKSIKPKHTKSYGRPIWAAEGLRQNTSPF